MAKGNTVVVIGIDGATWRVMSPFVDEGRLQNIASLATEGAWGNLITPLPPATSPGWPSLLTGKNPGAHGVFGFKDLTRDVYDPPIVDADSIKSRMFFEVAAEAGKRVCVMNFPMTYPLRKMDGVWLSGFLTPQGARDFYSPESIAPELIDFPMHEVRPKGEVTPDDALSFLDSLIDILKKRAGVIVKMAARERWDLFMCCFAETDRIHHFLWKYLDKGMPGYDAPGADGVRSRIIEVYEEIDRAVGEVVGIFGRDAVYMIGSDHGFQRTGSRNFHVNRMLMKMGLLKSNFYSIMRLLSKNKLLSSNTSIIDWIKTKAWAVSYQCGMCVVFINTKGRYPNGTVEPGTEYEAVVRRITEGLLAATDGGRRVVEKVHNRKDIYNGRYTEFAPDLSVMLADGYETPLSYRKDLKARGAFSDNEDVKLRSGRHDEKGVYVMSGGHIKHAGSSGDIRVEDIAPTALYLLGLAVPEDMDGTVRDEFIEDTYRASNRLEGIRLDEYAPVQATEKLDDQLIEAQLKGLGYL